MVGHLREVPVTARARVTIDPLAGDSSNVDVDVPGQTGDLPQGPRARRIPIIMAIAFSGSESTGLDD